MPLRPPAAVLCLVLSTVAPCCATAGGATAGGAAGGTGRDRISGPIAVEVMSVYDGDSFTVLAHMWPKQYVEAKVRVAGIDAPELRGRCEEEKKLAREAKKFVQKFLEQGEPITIKNVSLDKFGGRVDADVHNARGESLAGALIRAKLARVYHGGTKRGWC